MAKGRCKYKQKDGSCGVNLISGYCDNDDVVNTCDEYEEEEDNG